MSEEKRPKRAFFKKRDLLVLGALLLLAGGLFLVFRVVSGPAPATPRAAVTVGVGDEAVTEYMELSQDRVVEVEGGRLPVQLQVEDGGVRFVHSQCPDHLCEGFGLLRHEGDWASCLPAQVFVRVEEG